VTLLSLPPHDDRQDWLTMTPEGYAAGSPALLAEGRWLMGTQPVESASVWKALTNADGVARATRGETLQPPTFGK
jgi:hypothetical protein